MGECASLSVCQSGRQRFPYRILESCSINFETLHKKSLMLCIRKAFSEGTVVGNYLLERMEISGGYFSQPVEIYLRFKILFLEFEEKRDSIHIGRIGLLISSFSLLFPK